MCSSENSITILITGIGKILNIYKNIKDYSIIESDNNNVVNDMNLIKTYNSQTEVNKFINDLLKKEFDSFDCLKNLVEKVKLLDPLIGQYFSVAYREKDSMEIIKKEIKVKTIEKNSKTIKIAYCKENKTLYLNTL